MDNLLGFTDNSTNFVTFCYINGPFISYIIIYLHIITYQLSCQNKWASKTQPGESWQIMSVLKSG